MQTRWMILDKAGELVDGELFISYDRLLDNLQYHHDAGYIIVGFDHTNLRWGQVISPKTPLANVTHAVALDWWDKVGSRDTWEAVAAGEQVSWLADLYFGDEVAAYEARVEGYA